MEASMGREGRSCGRWAADPQPLTDTPVLRGSGNCASRAHRGLQEGHLGCGQGLSPRRHPFESRRAEGALKFLERTGWAMGGGCGPGWWALDCSGQGQCQVGTGTGAGGRGRGGWKAHVPCSQRPRFHQFFDFTDSLILSLACF